MTVWTKTGNSTWTKINSIFNKTGSSSWTELLGVWVKTASSTWTKVFTRVAVPANTVSPLVTGSERLYGTLSGTLGTWTAPNGTNSYARQWQSASNTGGTPGSYGNISGETSSTFTTTLSQNGRWVRLRVTATNLSGSSEAFSNEVLITKYAPVSFLAYTLSGTATVGSTLTASEPSGAWKNTTDNTGDTSPDSFQYEWSWSTGEIIQSPSYNAVNSLSYVIQSTDNGRVIRFRATGINTGGQATTSYTSSGTVGPAATVPGAVRNLSYSLITGGARITWDTPSSDGGSAITRYEVKRDSFAYFSVGTATSYDYTLSGGTYTIFVRAVNAIGNGPESSISVTVPVPTPTVNSCNVITGGRTGTSPNFLWPNPKALFTFTCSNASSADVQIEFSEFGTSWTAANVVQNLSVVSNQVSIQTNQPGTNIGNYYYRATCRPYSGSGGSGTSGTQRITAAVQNTATAKNQAVSIS